MRPPLGFTFAFARGITSSCLNIEFDSYKQGLLARTRGSGINAFSIELVSPLVTVMTFSSFGTTLPLGPPHLCSPSEIVFSCLWLLCSVTTAGPFGAVRKHYFSW